MTPSREEALFGVALETAPGELGPFLERECGGDQALRARIDVLLATHDAPNTALAPPRQEFQESRSPTSPFPARRDKRHESPSSNQDLPHLGAPMDEAPGHTLARYKLIERLGEGGFGEVAGPNVPLFHSASTFQVEALAVRRSARFSVGV